jgi:hypothetical protein
MELWGFNRGRASFQVSKTLLRVAQWLRKMKWTWLAERIQVGNTSFEWTLSLRHSFAARLEEVAMPFR